MSPSSPPPAERPSAPTKALEKGTPPFLERAGVDYLRSLSRGMARKTSVDPVHELDAAEREALRRIERGAVVRACIAGGLSTVVAGVAEVLVSHHEDDNALVFWGVVGGVTAVASIFEILYLYWDGLRSVHALSLAAGLDLFPEGDADYRVARAMARAALELPNAPDRLWGVDPRRESSKVRLLMLSLAYKLKVSVTNFLVKTLIRRVLGRAVVRTWLPFVAVPITAAWNGLVCYFILREARVRVMGASAAREMLRSVLRDAPPCSGPQREAMLRAVAATIVRTQDLHPNLVEVLGAARIALAVGGDGAGDEPGDTQDLDDTAKFLEVLAALPSAERPLVLRVLGVAAIIDGRMTGAERRLWADARVAAGLSPDMRPLEALLHAFRRGDAIPREVLMALA